MARQPLAIVVLQRAAVVEGTQDPVERSAMARHEAHFLVELLAPAGALVEARKGRKGFIAIIEVEQQVGIVARLLVLDVGMRRGRRHQIGNIADIGADFRADQMRAAIDRLEKARRAFIPPGAEYEIAVRLAAIGLGTLKRIGDVELEVLARLIEQAGCAC